MNVRSVVFVGSIFLAAAVGSLVGGFLADDSNFIVDSLDLKRLQIVDDDDTVRAQLTTMPNDFAALSFFDGEGDAKLIVGMFPDGQPSIYLNGESNKPMVAMVVDDEAPGVYLYHESSGTSPRIALSTLNGRPGIAIYDENDDPVWHVEQ